jgi:uncharacterized membrane protein
MTNNFLSGETMKRLQELVLASVVILVLAIATFAGEIPTGGKRHRHRRQSLRLRQLLAKPLLIPAILRATNTS